MRSVCIQCGLPYTPYVRMGICRQKYCSKKCSAEANRFDCSSGLGLSTGTVGAIAELEISTDLLKKGYEVFRALSPSCSCDILILKNGVSRKIEVRSGSRTKTGKLIHPNKNFRADMWAIFVHRTKEIIYIPELPKDDTNPPNA